MKKTFVFYRLLTVVVLSFCFFACTKPNDNNNTSSVRVTTLTPTDITSTGAACGAEVVAEAGATLMELGVCWSTSAYPTVNDNYLSTKNCETTYVCTLENLTPETKYHVRAYALNGTNYVYGDDKEFVTLADGGGGGNGGGGNGGGGGGISYETMLPGTWNMPSPIYDDLNVNIIFDWNDVPGKVFFEYATNYTGISANGIYTLSGTTITANYTTVVANLSNYFETWQYGHTYGFVDGQSKTVAYTIQSCTANELVLQESAMGETLRLTRYSGGNGGGNGGGTTPTLPSVTTLQMTDITQTSAVGGGCVTEDGGATILERGICWSTSPTPTFSDNHSKSGTDDSNYNIRINDLIPGTTYYVRAYVTDSTNRYYGEDVCFTTLPGGGGGMVPDAPTGAIKGLFSVSETKQVWFSKGNLQYIGTASTPYWKFAEHQWDFFGNNGNANELPNKNYDLFAWGTSGYNHGAICYQPWEMQSNNDHDAYGVPLSDLFDCDGKADWGYNAISNGGNVTHQWRTPTAEEWDFLFKSRVTTSGIRYALGKVNGKRGVILLPDGWDASIYSLHCTNEQPLTPPFEDFCQKNIISSSVWTSKFEVNGAVFLPFCGDRYYGGSHNVLVHSVNENTKVGYYQSSSCTKDNYPWVYVLSITSYHGAGVFNRSPRSVGYPVRLVQDYK